MLPFRQLLGISESPGIFFECSYHHRWSIRLHNFIRPSFAWILFALDSLGQPGSARVSFIARSLLDDSALRLLADCMCRRTTPRSSQQFFVRAPLSKNVSVAVNSCILPQICGRTGCPASYTYMSCDECFRLNGLKTCRWSKALVLCRLCHNSTAPDEL